MSEVSDETLAREAKKGSLPAFEALVRRHDATVFAFCRYRTGNVEDARDLTQQTFINALRKLNKYRSSRPFGPWLFTIARNLCIDHLRRRRDSGPPEDEDWVDSDNPAQAAELADIWIEVRRHVNETEFTALWLHYQQGLNIVEIAPVIQKSTGATKVLLSRTRQRLREALEPGILHAGRRAPFQGSGDPFLQPQANCPS